MLAPNFVVNAAHDDAAIDETIDAVAASLSVYRMALDDGIDKHLAGRPVQPVFRKFN